MTDKDALELLNMFTTATQLAKKKNEKEFHLQIDEIALSDLLKKAFPSLKDNDNTINIAKKILSN